MTNPVGEVAGPLGQSPHDPGADSRSQSRTPSAASSSRARWAIGWLVRIPRATSTVRAGLAYVGQGEQGLAALLASAFRATASRSPTGGIGR